MNITKQVVILSAESAIQDSLNNEQKTNLLRNCLEDLNLNYGEGQGLFRGEGPQTSFVVLPKTNADIEALKSFAFTTFKQQSILFQDSNQEAYLLNHDGTETRLGRLQEVTKSQAEEIGSYTILKGKYYSTVAR